MTVLRLCSLLLFWAPLPLHGQDLEAADVRVPLDSALRLAHQAAATVFPELSKVLALLRDPAGPQR
jgi:hypothetical protein